MCSCTVLITLARHSVKPILLVASCKSPKLVITKEVGTKDTTCSSTAKHEDWQRDLGERSGHQVLCADLESVETQVSQQAL